MHSISNERPLSIGGMQPPLVEDNKGSSQATQVAAGDSHRHVEKHGQGVVLPQPMPGIRQQVGVSQQQELDQLRKTAQLGAANAAKLLGSSTLLNKLALASPEEFEIELGKMTSELEQTQKKLKLADLERIRAENLKKIDENQTKMKEASEAADKAKKSGLASKIFGWISAIASMVIGAILIATGVGAAVGAMMIVGGAVGVANMAIQQAAADGRISPETMKVLGPIMIAAEILVAIVSIAVTFGASAASTAMKAVKFATQAADLVVDIGTGTAKAIDSGLQADAQIKQANLLENRQVMTELQGVMDKLKEALSQMTESFQQVMEMIFQMITAKGAMLNSLASRPTAI
ncbi:type III secretion system translocon subunit SctE [Aeromonas hydrophila]|uniref:type III secretion system translocon subunit SctE n=1 Tax=Aeromonas hydrophila TaxID=644 RepID=UPI003988A744